MHSSHLTRIRAMEDAVEDLGTRLGVAYRKSAADQARAYRDYSALLDRFSKKEIKTIEFGRDAIDLYIGAVGDWFSTTADAAGDVLNTGLKRVGIGRAKGEQLVDKTVRAVNQDAGGADPNQDGSS